MSPGVLQLADSLAEAAFLVSAEDGQILFANMAARELFAPAVGGQNLTGQRLDALLIDAPEKLAQYLRLCARSRQPLPGAFTWRGGDHQAIETRCDAAVFQPSTPTTPAIVFLRCRARTESTEQFNLLNQKIAELSRQILERKKAEQQRDELLRAERAARIEAERNSRMKDEFLATLSHELRTPLNAILGWTQLLRDSANLSDDVSEGLEVIDRNARVQKQLVEDLLDMSRIISGKVRLDVQRVDLPAIIEAAVESVRPAAEARQIRLQVTLDPLAGPVKGDPGRLQQVVWNLLSNAVKFTPRGGRVQVFLERVNSHVEVIVTDTGEGIRPEFLPHVFDRFRQADSSTTRRHGGLGLGLSIVKQLVELHGGTVRAKSPGEGQGSTFTVHLPLLVLHDQAPDPAAVHPTAAAAPVSVRGLPSLDGVRVLMVDDDHDAQELVRRLLDHAGAETQTAGSATEALRLLEQMIPDVLVSDIGMPDIDGYEFMRRVRALPPERGGRIPAIALTAFARSEDRTRAMLAGFNVHLAKPLESIEFLATVASLAGRTGGSPDNAQ